MGSARLYVVCKSSGSIIATDDIDVINEFGTALVLGAGVRDDGVMSPILRERAMTAGELYMQKKICTIIISGIVAVDDTGATYDEVTPVRDHLITVGVAPGDIITDAYGFDTFQSIVNVHKDHNVDQLIIITQDFHQARAVYIARALGIDARGYVANAYPYVHKGERLYYELREWPAAVKAIIEVATRR
jgi:vancomycin permeability regulator SanA